MSVWESPLFRKSSSSPARKKLKPAVSATRVPSARSANQWENKGLSFLSSAFFLTARFKNKKIKKRGKKSQLFNLHSSKTKR